MRHCIALAAAAFVIACGPNPSYGQSGIVEHAGRCDASAAVALSPDLFVVANDEDNVFRFYRPGQPAAAAERDLSASLETDPKDEVDIEGAARMGGLVYWISSHGRNKDGKRKQERERLFATEIKAEGGAPEIKLVHKPYKRLLKDLVEAGSLAKLRLRKASERKPESPGGLNVEGLAATPQGQLLIAFRSPLPRDKALLVPLENPERTVKGEEAPRFGAAIELDLGGRGVRSIDYVDARKAFVIVAGPPADEGSFALFQWGGPGGPPPTPVAGIAFGDLKPEAVAAAPGSDALLVVSDDGGRALEGQDCKDLGSSKRRFQVTTINLD